MRIKLLLAVIFLLVSTHSAFAAGGACPTSASYLNATNPTSSLVTLASQGITACFYIAANGSDSNNGTSEATPWLHAPGMTSCTGSCASNAPSGGTGYIFRGGDTWHFGTSLALLPTRMAGIGLGTENLNRLRSTWESIRTGIRKFLGPAYSQRRQPHQGVSRGRSMFGGELRERGDQRSLQPDDLVQLDCVECLDDFEITGFCWNNETNVGNGGNVMLSYYSGAGQGTVTPYFFVPDGFMYTAGRIPPEERRTARPG